MLIVVGLVLAILGLNGSLAAMGFSLLSSSSFSVVLTGIVTLAMGEMMFLATHMAADLRRLAEAK
jgi:hypothetical protein